VQTRSRRSSISVWSRSYPAPCSVVVGGSSLGSRDDVPRRRTTLVRGRRRSRCDSGRPCRGAWEIAIRHYPCEGCRCHYRPVSDLGALAALVSKVDRTRSDERLRTVDDGSYQAMRLMGGWTQVRAEDSVVACRLACEVVRKHSSSRSSRNLGVACSGCAEVQCPGKATGYAGWATVCLEGIQLRIEYLRPIEHHLVYLKIGMPELLLSLLLLLPLYPYGDSGGV